jgi:hypothetical protein
MVLSASSDAVIVSSIALVLTFVGLLINMMMFCANAQLTIRMKECILEVHVEQEDGEDKGISLELCNRSEEPVRIGRIWIKSRETPTEQIEITNLEFDWHFETYVKKVFGDSGYYKAANVKSRSINALEAKEHRVLLKVPGVDGKRCKLLKEYIEKYYLCVEIGQTIVRLWKGDVSTIWSPIQIALNGDNLKSQQRRSSDDVN